MGCVFADEKYKVTIDPVFSLWNQCEIKIIQYLVFT